MPRTCGYMHFVTQAEADLSLESLRLIAPRLPCHIGSFPAQASIWSGRWSGAKELSYDDPEVGSCNLTWALNLGEENWRNICNRLVGAYVESMIREVLQPTQRCGEVR